MKIRVYFLRMTQKISNNLVDIRQRNGRILLGDFLGRGAIPESRGNCIQSHSRAAHPNDTVFAGQ